VTAIEHVPTHRWRAFAVLAVAFFMTIVDLSIVNVALPTIGRSLQFSESNNARHSQIFSRKPFGQRIMSCIARSIQL